MLTHALVRLKHHAQRALGTISLCVAGLLPQSLTAHDVPEHWVRYATLASQQLEDRLSNTEEEHVAQLQQWLRKSQDLTRSVVVAVWISSTGKIHKLEFAPLTHAAANEALEYLLSSTHLSEPPPSDMPQPLRLQLGLGDPQRTTP